VVVAAKPFHHADRAGGVFVVHEHHASQLHWDVRFDRGGVLVSWMVPKGLPAEPEVPRLAVRTEEAPPEYTDFEGELPGDELGGGTMKISDHGRYETLHWNDHKVEVIFEGARTRGRYVFWHRPREGRERDWVVRRVSPAEAGHETLPSFVPPMPAVPGVLPPVAEDREWAYEFAWDGMRAQVRAQGGRVTVRDRKGDELTAKFPELRGLGEHLGDTEVLLDGVLVAFEHGKPSLDALARRTHVTLGAKGAAAQVKRLTERNPVVFLATDLLHLDGRSRIGLPYLRRRRLLAALELEGPHWRAPDCHCGSGAAVLEAARANGLAGIVAKRRDSPYRPGRPGRDWVEITGVRVLEVVVGGWQPGSGGRARSFGSLLLGVPGEDGLRYVGNVGTGFSQAMLTELSAEVRRLERPGSPFESVPSEKSRDAHWVRPELVGEVVFADWTPAGRLRSPRWRGLRSG
jgi:bifunctional non-homologous end joining protein LigD